VSVLSNIQTSISSSTSAVTATFNYQNVDPQTGTIWRDTCIDYSRSIIFLNAFGVFGVYGGSASKISGKLDDLFTNLVLPANGGVTPSGAVANVFSQKALFFLMTIKDIYTGDDRTVLIGWNERDWFVASQSVDLIQIGSQEINSDLYAWGTDGTSLYPLFTTPSTSLTKSLSTKLYGVQSGIVVKQAMGLYIQAQDLTTNGSGISFSTETIDNEFGSYPVPNALVFPSTVPANPPFSPVLCTESGDVQGVELGVTLKSTSADFAINYLALGYIDVVGLFGSTNLTDQTGV
jgi:hypothetical protein